MKRTQNSPDSGRNNIYRVPDSPSEADTNKQNGMYINKKSDGTLRPSAIKNATNNPTGTVGRRVNGTVQKSPRASRNTGIRPEANGTAYPQNRYRIQSNAQSRSNIPTDQRYNRMNTPNSQRDIHRTPPRQKRGESTASVYDNEDGSSLKERLYAKFNMWRLSFSIDVESLLKGVIFGVFIIFFSIIQTTLFARFRPFGVVPDLLLPFVVAVGISERERWGAVVGLISAFVIDALGGTTLMLLPLLYVPAGFICGILTTYRFRDSFSVIAVYTLITSFLRSFISMIIAFNTIHRITFGETLLNIALPEFFVNIIFAAIPHILIKLVMRPFHKTRAERTSGIE